MISAIGAPKINTDNHHGCVDSGGFWHLQSGMKNDSHSPEQQILLHHPDIFNTYFHADWLSTHCHSLVSRL